MNIKFCVEVKKLSFNKCIYFFNLYLFIKVYIYGQFSTDIWDVLEQYNK